MGVILRENRVATSVAQGIEVFNVPDTAIAVLFQADTCIIRATTVEGDVATPTHGIRYFPRHHPQYILIEDFKRISFILEALQEECVVEVTYIGPPEELLLSQQDEPPLVMWEEQTSVVWEEQTTAIWELDVESGISSSASYSSLSSSSSRSSSSSASFSSVSTSSSSSSSSSASSLSTSSASSSSSSSSSSSASSQSSSSSSQSSISTSSSSAQSSSSSVSTSSASSSSQSSLSSSSSFSSKSSLSSQSSSSRSSASSISTSSSSQSTSSSSQSSLSSSSSSSSSSHSSSSTSSQSSSSSSQSTSTSSSSTSSSSGTLPATSELTTPYWLTSYEDFYPNQYPKPGLHYTLPTCETVFKEDTVLVARNDTELAQHLSTAQSNGNIEAIWLDPVPNSWSTFHWPINAGRLIVRGWSDPLVIRTHPGKPRAHIEQIFFTKDFQGVLAFVDLQFNQENEPDGIVAVGGGEGLLIEKCIGSFNLQGTTAVPLRNCQVRLCNIHNHWKYGQSNHQHGIYCDTYEGLLIEGCIIHHNGWTGTRATIPDDGGPTQQKHNLYLNDPGQHGIVRWNIVSEASSHGVHFKSGGRVYDNLLLRNPIHMQLGYGADQQYENYGPDDWSRSWRNLILDSDVISTGVPRGVAHWVVNNIDCFIEDNLMLYNSTRGLGSFQSCVHFEKTYNSVANVSRNKARQWYGSQPVTVGGTGVATVLVNGTILNTGQEPVFTDNNWDCNLSSAAQTIVDTLIAPGYVDGLIASQVGISPIDLQSIMFAILQGAS